MAAKKPSWFWRGSPPPPPREPDKLVVGNIIFIESLLLPRYMAPVGKMIIPEGTTHLTFEDDDDSDEISVSFHKREMKENPRYAAEMQRYLKEKKIHDARTIEYNQLMVEIEANEAAAKEKHEKATYERLKKKFEKRAGGK